MIRNEYMTGSIFMHHTEGAEATDDYDLHCHSQYELIYFEDGDVSYLVEGRAVKPKPYSVIIMGPNMFHGVKVNSNEPYKRYVLHFSADAIPENARSMLLEPFERGLDKNYYENVRQFAFRESFDDIYSCKSMPLDMQPIAVQAAVSGLLVKLLYMCRTVDDVTPKGSVNSAIGEVIKYLNENISSPLSLEMLSKKFYISKHHMNKVFKKATGTTVGKYVNYKRITQAQQLIMQGYSAARAATEAGFGDYSSFYRAYTRLLGHVPSNDKINGEDEQ